MKKKVPKKKVPRKKCSSNTEIEKKNTRKINEIMMMIYCNLTHTHTDTD